MRTKGPIYVVMREALIRRDLVAVLRAHRYAPTPFASGSDFLDAARFISPGTAVLDMDLPDMTGLTVLQELLFKRRDIPVVMTSARSDIRAAVQTIKRGADDFLEQPVNEADLLATIENSQSLLKNRIIVQKEKMESESILGKLSSREMDVLKELALYGDNSRAASNLNLSVRSVETYRCRIMRKCGAAKFFDVVTMYQRVFA